MQRSLGSTSSTLEATQEIEAGGSEIQGHSWLHSQVLGQPGAHETLFQRDKETERQRQRKLGENAIM